MIWCIGKCLYFFAKINFEEVGSSGSVVTVTISNKTCPTLKLGLILLEFDLLLNLVVHSLKD
jgi:hypothetical protein